MLDFLTTMRLCVSSPSTTDNLFETAAQLFPEPLAHQAVDVEVEAGVEDDEDVVEVCHTIPGARDRMSPSFAAGRHPENNTSVFQAEVLENQETQNGNKLGLSCAKLSTA